MTLNLTEKVQKLESARASVARLELEIGNDLGLITVTTPGAPVRGYSVKISAPRIPRKLRKRTRAVVTDETRAEVKRLSKAGKVGHEIAEAVGVSEGTVINIKKALGLVKLRKKK